LRNQDPAQVSNLMTDKSQENLHAL
jgi:hypothetical protein